MSDKPPQTPGASTPTTPDWPDPDASPYKAPPVEGMPYERGSDEDLAIRRVIRETEAERRDGDDG